MSRSNPPKKSVGNREYSDGPGFVALSLTTAFPWREQGATKAVNEATAQLLDELGLSSDPEFPSDQTLREFVNHSRHLVASDASMQSGDGTLPSVPTYLVFHVDNVANLAQSLATVAVDGHASADLTMNETAFMVVLGVTDGPGKGPVLPTTSVRVSTDVSRLFGYGDREFPFDGRQPSHVTKNQHPKLVPPVEAVSKQRKRVPPPTATPDTLFEVTTSTLSPDLAAIARTIMSGAKDGSTKALVDSALSLKTKLSDHKRHQVIDAVAMNVLDTSGETAAVDFLKGYMEKSRTPWLHPLVVNAELHTPMPELILPETVAWYVGRSDRSAPLTAMNALDTRVEPEYREAADSVQLLLYDTYGLEARQPDVVVAYLSQLANRNQSQLHRAALRSLRLKAPKLLDQLPDNLRQVASSTKTAASPESPSQTTLELP